MARDPRDRSRAGMLAGLMMTPQEVADLYGVHWRTVHRWIAAGRYPHAAKVGGVWRVPASDVTRDLPRQEALQVARALRREGGGQCQC